MINSIAFFANLRALNSGVNIHLARKLEFFNIQPFEEALRNSLELCGRFKTIAEKNTNSILDLGNFNIYDQKAKAYIYKDPSKDIGERLEFIKQKYEAYPMLFIYGLGNGFLVKELAKYKKVFVYESELEIIKIVLEKLDLSKELSTGKISIIYLDEELVNLQLSVILRPFIGYLRLYELLFNSPYYESFYSKELLKANEITIKAITKLFNLLDFNLKASKKIYKNHFQNMPALLRGVPYQRLIKQRQKKYKTALIVAAGPSLTKQIELLKKHQDSFLIIALDATYSILAKNNIRADFVLGIDIYSVNESLMGELKADSFFILSSSYNPSSLEKVIKSKAKYALCLDSLHKADYLDEYGYFNAGMNVAYAAYNLALALKVEKIIAIGQDLAYTNGVSHAKDYALGEEAELNTAFASIKARAYKGEGFVYTIPAYKAYKEQLELLILQNQDIVWINSTEGGVHIENMQELEFLKVCKLLSKENKEAFSIRPISSKEGKVFLKKHISFLNKNIKGLELNIKKLDTLQANLAKDLKASIKNFDDFLNSYKNQNYDLFFWPIYVANQALVCKLLINKDEKKYEKKLKNIYHKYIEELKLSFKEKISTYKDALELKILEDKE